MSIDREPSELSHVFEQINIELGVIREMFPKPEQKRLITSRIDFDGAMMLAAVALSARGTCRDRAVGCILTAERRIVATGYNGSLPGKPHCQDVGCLTDTRGRCIRCNHAEINALGQLTGKVPDTAYCTLMPCLNCLRAMLGAGVVKIIYWIDRNDEDVNAFVEANYNEQEPGPLLAVGGELSGLLETTNSAIREYLH